MDLEIGWSLEAIEDLEAIAEYIARDSEFYARAVVTEILSVSRNIGEFPLIGRPLGQDRSRPKDMGFYLAMREGEARRKMRYSAERKEAVLKKMLPPNNRGRRFPR